VIGGGKIGAILGKGKKAKLHKFASVMHIYAKLPNYGIFVNPGSASNLWGTASAWAGNQPGPQEAGESASHPKASEHYPESPPSFLESEPGLT
jgi:hypothetical protein